jgi:two-component system NarL family sensor kinase
MRSGRARAMQPLPALGPVVNSDPPAALRTGLRWVLPVLLLLAGLSAAAVLYGRAVEADPAGDGTYSPHPVAGFAFLLVGGAIIRRRPQNAIGWLFAGVGLATAAVAVCASFAGWEPMLWVNQSLPAVAYGLMPLALLIFPDGRLPGRRWRAVMMMGIGALAVTFVFLGWATWLSPRVILERPEPLTGELEMVFEAGRAGAVGILLTMVLAVASLVVRRRRADGDTRQQIKVLTVGALAIPIGIVLEIVQIPGGDVAAAVAVPVAAGAAVLKYRLYDLDLFLNRSIVYAVLTALLVATYAAVATVLGSAFGNTWGSPLVATGVVAVAFQPLRERIQLAVSRLLFGQRDDPYSVVSGLGRILEPATAPDAVLERVAQAVTGALGLPFAAIETVDAAGAARRAASSGRERVEAERIPMEHGGRVVGYLIASPRTAAGSFTTRERSLLEVLARQTGVAVHAMQLTDDLRASRARLIRSREEERLRLRRELHDGLGPVLAGATMQVGAVRHLPEAEVEPTLNKLEGMLQTCLSEIRQIVNDLRPPSLDALGLSGAIIERATVFSASKPAPRISVSATGNLEGLPAAVEVAAYRIAIEAVTNAVRHSGASACSVELSRDTDLVLQIIDDGTGIPDSFAPGVGLGSMRERAEELGGKLVITSNDGGGTRVLARLPLVTA